MSVDILIEKTEKLDLPDSDITLYKSSYLTKLANDLFPILEVKIPWEQRYIEINGTYYKEPRYVCWYGNYAYTYSGIKSNPRPWIPILFKVKNIMEKITNTSFNGVLLNYYKDGNSSIGMHSDNELELGYRPTIASFSLGETRKFKFRHKYNSLFKQDIDLENGSVLVMKGRTQEFYKHGISKSKKSLGPRINLTFRQIHYST